MKGIIVKNILIIEPQSSGLNFVTAAKKLGFRVTVMTANTGDRKVCSQYTHLIDQLIIHDTNDAKGSINAAKVAHKKFPFTCVVPGFEYYVPLTAMIASELELRGISVEAVEALRLKNKMREKLSESGILVPQFYQASSMSDILKIADTANFPLVIKPINLSGSLGVQKVLTKEELIAAAANLWGTFTSDLDLEICRNLLVEEYISGQEFSAEGYVTEDGAVHFLSITKKLLGPEPYFVETGHIVNFKLNTSVENEIKKYITEVIHVLGITIGPFHGEFRLRDHDQQPILMEIAARLAGDKICELIKLSKGIDLAEVSLKILSGENISSVDDTINLAAGITFFVDKGAGSSEHYLRHLRLVPGLVSSQLEEKTLGHKATDFSGRLGHALFVNKSVELVNESIISANRLIFA